MVNARSSGSSSGNSVICVYLNQSERYTIHSESKVMKFTLTRLQLVFVCLGAILFFVFLYRAQFVFFGKRANGEVVGGYVWGLAKAADPEIRFFRGNTPVLFKGEQNMRYQQGEIVPVIYLDQPDPDAHLYTFFGFWLKPLICSLVPIIFLVPALFSFFHRGDTFAFSLSKPFGMKVIRDAEETLKKMKEDAKEAETRMKARQRMKSGERKR